MIYIETDSMDACYNFGLEYYFSAEKQLPDTVFLFWRTVPTLMIGKFQNVLEEVNIPYANTHGIKIVRRMSGGGTIYTDTGGWQFSFIQHNAADQIEFREYIAPVIEALQEVGVNARFNGRNDLTIDGKKISGNAQYRLHNCVVHHGSLLFDTNIDQMAAATTVSSYKILSKGIKSVHDRVTNIASHMNRPITPQEFKENMVRHVMGGSMQTYHLTQEDRIRIQQIGREKFEGWENLYGTNPAFNIQRTGHFSGGMMTFKLDVKKGVIQSASVSGDFFSTMDTSDICAALIGCQYERSAVLEALKSNFVDGAVYNISVDEMAALIVDESSAF